MKSIMRLPFLILLGANLLATRPLAAQTPAFVSDGQPDPQFAVPPALNLHYSLAFALDNNFAIRQAKERIRQQEGVVVEVSAQHLPHVSAAGGYQRNDAEIGSNGDNHNWSLNLTARQLLYTGGGVRAGVQSQQLRLEAAMLALRTVINDALLDVRIRFYTVLVNRERIKVQEQNIELLQRQLQDVKNRFEAGTVSNFEVLRAEVALANAQPDLITARNDYRLAIEQLRFVLGFATAQVTNADQTIEFLGELAFSPVSFDMASALATARETRPDLQLLHKLEQAAEQGVTIQRSNYYPDLALFGAYDMRKGAGSSGFASARDGWTVGLQSTWSLFDGRATAGRVAQARSSLEQARLSSEEARLAVDVEVRRAISTLQQATELAEASKKVVEQAAEAVRLANARFSAGTATQLDVLTSQVDLTTARLNQLRAYYSFNVSVVTLRRAMGLPDDMLPANAAVDAKK